MDEARRIASNIAKLRTTSRLILKCTIEHERGALYSVCYAPYGSRSLWGSVPPNSVAMFGSPKILDTASLLLS
jgi:hypothetical protein